MSLTNRITTLEKLGEFLGQFHPSEIKKKENIINNDLFFDSFQMQIKRAKEFNGWFTEENILNAFYNWSEILTTDKLNNWLSVYNFEKHTIITEFYTT